MNLLDTLQSRHLFEAATSEALRPALNKPITVYCGFDPTNRSLQAGNLVAITVLAHFQRAGHKVIALVGGATGLIGDPSGKSTERNALTAEEVQYNLEGIKENLSRFLDFNPNSANPATLVNNYDWFKDFTFITLLRDVGRYFRVNAMLAKDSVKKRLESQDGMSFTEFCYQILQGYDFYHLYKTRGCRLQIGGSDQWGNITAGTDYIRRMGITDECFGMTIPLVTDSQGRKFGKSEGNAVYLDHTKTSYYDFYQFFLRSTDVDVIRYLKIFTFLPMERIAELETLVATAPEKREAQKVLAEEMTRSVHGAHGLEVAQRASNAFFGGSLDGLTAAELESVFASVPSKEIPNVIGQPLLDIAAASGLCASKSEARRLLQQGGLSINQTRVTDPAAVVTPDMLIEGRIMVLRSGKKSYCLVKA